MQLTGAASAPRRAESDGQGRFPGRRSRARAFRRRQEPIQPWPLPSLALAILGLAFLALAILGLAFLALAVLCAAVTAIWLPSRTP